MTREQRHYTRAERDQRAALERRAYEQAVTLAIRLGAERRDYAASTLAGAAILARRIQDQHAASLGVRS